MEPPGFPGRFKDLKSVRLAVPSREEQTRQVACLDRANGKFEELCLKLEEQVHLLGEHRSALVTAAITGELDIPGAAA
jgi:type I restriction enzyme S subunit